MNKSVLMALTLALIGIVFLIGGVSAAMNLVASKAICEACGMEVEKTDISSFQVIDADAKEHWACCPICAEMVGVYYVNSEINGKCYATEKSIKITVVSGNFSSASVTPSDPMNNVTIVLGGSCRTNKIVSDPMHGDTIRQTYDWASNVSLKTMPQSFMAAKAKLSQMTVGYKPVAIPSLNYVLMGVGAAFMAISPVSWKLGKRELPQ